MARGMGGAAETTGLHTAIGAALPAAGVVVDRLVERGPFDSEAAFVATALDVVCSLCERDKVALVDGHPRLGDDPERLRNVAPLSYDEQLAGGPTEAHMLERLGELNREYERRFGFRFVTLVAGRPLADVVTQLEACLDRGRADELDRALRDVVAIAAQRLKGAW